MSMPGSLAVAAQIVFGCVLAAEGDLAPAELALFADLPEVVSGSRLPAAWAASPMAITVLSGEDVTGGSRRTLSDVLRAAAGVDVLRIDRGHAAVGVRGLHGRFSDRTLVLVDGVPFENLVDGGVDEERLTLGLGDLERIEVVRGPASAAWGANALNGAVHLITRDPEDALGARAEVVGTHHGDAWAQASVAERWDGGAWRLSAGAASLRSSAEAAGADGDAGDDAVRSGRVRADVAVPVGAARLRASLGHAAIRRGSYEFLRYDPNRPARIAQTEADVRVVREARVGTGWSLGWHGTYAVAGDPTLVEESRSHRHVVTAQTDLDAGPGHRLSVGGDGAWTRLSFQSGDDPAAFDFGGPHRIWQAGIFAIDHVRLGRGLATELQGRADRSTATGVDWGGRVAVLADLDDAGRQVLRLGGGRGYRSPYLALRSARAERGYTDLPGIGVRPVTLVRTDPDGVRNESAWSAEAGYAGVLGDLVEVRLEAWWMRYRDLLGARVTPAGLAYPANRVTFTNGAGARAWGAEAEAALDGSWGRIAAHYAYHRLRPDQSDQGMRAFGPATHKAGLRSTTELGAGWAAELSWWGATATPQDPLAGMVTDAPDAAPAHHRTDLSASYRFARGRGRLAAGVDDLWDGTPTTWASGSFQPHAVPGRTAWMRAGWEF
jgi:outer membrane receptor for ferrienterochelin and colicin